MNIRSVVYERMRERQLSTADVDRLLGGRVRQRTLYDFLTGFNDYLKAYAAWDAERPQWNPQPPSKEPKVADWEVKSVTAELRRQIYEENDRQHAIWVQIKADYEASFAKHDEAVIAWQSRRPQPEAFFRNAAPMGADNLNHLLEVLELLIVPAELIAEHQQMLNERKELVKLIEDASEQKNNAQS